MLVRRTGLPVGTDTSAIDEMSAIVIMAVEAGNNRVHRQGAGGRALIASAAAERRREDTYVKVGDRRKFELPLRALSVGRTADHATRVRRIDTVRAHEARDQIRHREAQK